ncbi:atrial natriuretic peptide receptor 1-like [Anneissia japonica]|uniref:atrial natriuretic peptide receptor 1-like n=1 Tax=Anneissia japonica TaxID=1529436 RepID=UPI0014256B27|nr:atrial natriuretic peptide receptor 1-like [Anneissia japonica]
MMLIIIRMILLIFSLLMLSTNCAGKDFRLGFLVPWDGFWPVGQRAGGAMTVAIETINNDSNFSAIHDGGHTLSFIWNDTDCDTSKGLASILDMYEKYSVDAFIGPGCSVICEPGGYLANHWKTPMISWSCSSSALSDKNQYPNFARSTAPTEKMSPFFVEIMKHFEFSRVGIYFSSQHIWSLAADAFRNAFRENGIEVSIYQVFEPGSDNEKHSSGHQDASDSVSTLQIEGDALAEAKLLAKVFIILAYGSDVRNFLLLAKAGDMINGEYAFFSIEVPLASRFGENGWMGNDTKDDDAIEAFEGLLDVKLLEPSCPEYEEFKKEVRLKTSQSPFYYSLPQDEQVLLEAALIYDSVYLYALALNKSLGNGMDPSDSGHVGENLFDWEFNGADGLVSIDLLGDRRPNYMLQNIQNGTFVTIASFQSRGAVFEEVSSVVVWPGGGLEKPHGIPDCGWDNEFCEVTPIDKVVVLGVFAVVLLLFIICTIVYILHRNHLYEQELENMSWRIDYSDISFEAEDELTTIFGTNSFPRSHASIAKLSDRVGTLNSSTLSLVGDLRYTKVGCYIGTRVAIKQIRRSSSIQLNRQILKEFKDVRELNHLNVNQIVGACIEAPNICILTNYCSRGSLQDVLMNDHIKLDYLFKWSFASDIAKGMAYLHGTPIEAHGRLNSSKCLVDSRWVCKISDFGLNSLRCDQELNQGTRERYYSKQLWTAPELLRQNYPRCRSTKQGDTYSYGIILQEIILRDAPYCMIEMEAEEIICKIRTISNPPFRPEVDDKDTNYSKVVRLMKTCWDEDPSCRPPFSYIINYLKRVSGGKSGNLIDNMVAMLEKHAVHLEELVTERTKQLADEKLKTDALLYQMLPKSVADSLKRGKVVQPESFEEVTIFFSDIVEFTKLAAESSPLQVVDLLNDLYTCFDTIIENYQVYKVETIGDAYMVVSGLPVRNGHCHATHVCMMALNLLSVMSSFEIRHRPGKCLQLRIGIHSGPVVAGVVGVKMPRYCLFGDTVNYASRMESTGEALKIHVSSECHRIISKSDVFQFQKRGNVNLKGIGSVTTYFLTGLS